MEADALSTALFVLGSDEGLALVGRRGAQGLVVGRDAVGRRWIRTTPGFAGGRAVLAPERVPLER
jgi:thiamine biosynthesis lipoprotein ApbE